MKVDEHVHDPRPWKKRVLLPSGITRNLESAGHYRGGYARRKQCIEMCSADQSAQSTENFLFAFIRMGSSGTFVFCTARSRCMRIDAAERRSGESWSPSIDSTSVDRSVPSAVMV